MKPCEYEDCGFYMLCKKDEKRHDKCDKRKDFNKGYNKAKSECVAVLNNRLKHYLETVDRNIKNNEFNNDHFHGVISELERLIEISQKP